MFIKTTNKLPTISNQIITVLASNISEEIVISEHDLGLDSDEKGVG